MERMENDIFAIITELENYLESAKRVPLTNQIMLERSSALNLIKMMRDSLPEAIKSANRITNQESRILQEAKKHYDCLLYTSCSSRSGLSFWCLVLPCSR